MNILKFPFGFFLALLLMILGKTRFKRIVINDAYAKLLIITGVLNWHDLPHLHNPLIHFFIDLEFRKSIKKVIK